MSVLCVSESLVKAGERRRFTAKGEETRVQIHEGSGLDWPDLGTSPLLESTLPGARESIVPSPRNVFPSFPY